MLKFPAAIIDSLFEAKLKQRAIIKFEMPCDDPNRDSAPKFGVVLNKNTTDPDVLLAITTSQMGFYQNGNLENLIS
jgi:hypothetical protein